VKPVLRIPTYRRLLAAYALNELAFMIGSVALALLVYRRTGSAIGATAFFLAAQFVPALVSPMAVARLDQLPVRAVLPLLHWFEAVIYVILAWVASSDFSVGLVLALAFVDGVVALVARALTRTATVSVTSAAGLLRDGNAVSNAAFSVCFMVGPGLGGALVAAGGTSLALLVNAAIFAICGLNLVTARGLPQPAPEKAPAKGRVRAALAYVRQKPAIRGLFLLQTVAVFFFTISVPVEVVFAQHSLHAGAAGYGAMLSAWGAGAVAGAAIYARFRARPNRELIVGGAFSLGVGFVVMAVAPTLAVAIVGAALGGVGNGVESVAARTAMQEEADERWMAMLMGLYEALFQSVPGVGMLIGGAVAALGTPRTALAVAGIGSLAVTATAWVVLAGLGPHGALDEPETGPQGEPTRGGPRREPARTPAVRHQ
jgi:Transmembrane secretion effector